MHGILSGEFSVVPCGSLVQVSASGRESLADASNAQLFRSVLA
jgi:hypothetical protein